MFLSPAPLSDPPAPRVGPAVEWLAGMTPEEKSPAVDEPAREHAGLLQAMARGDKAALARLYDLLSRPLYALALRVTSDAAEAQDVVQDVFLQLWHKAADYSPARGSVFSWAATLTRNRAIDRVRMRKRRSEIVQTSAADIYGGDTGASDATSADQLWVAEKATAVRQALSSLAPEQKAALELAYFSGLTQQEIAARLQEPLGTVKARIRRGLMKLREILSARL